MRPKITGLFGLVLMCAAVTAVIGLTGDRASAAGKVRKAPQQERQRVLVSGVNKESWKTAVDILRQEVGAAAVQGGALVIPEGAVSFYSDDLVTVRDEVGSQDFGSTYLRSTREVLVRFNGARSSIAFFSRQSRNQDRASTLSDGCRLTEERAGEIMRVVAYLRTVSVPSGSPWEKGLNTSAFHMDSPKAELVTQTTGEGEAVLSGSGANAGGDGKAGGFLETLRANCIMRYLSGLRSDGSIALTKSPDELIPILSDMALETASRRTPWSWGDICEAFALIEPFTDVRLLAVLDTLFKGFRSAESTQYMPDFAAYSYPSSVIEAHIWITKQTSGKTAEQQAELLAKTAFGKGPYTALRHQAGFVLRTYRPEAWRQAVLAGFDTLPKWPKDRVLDEYYHLFPDDGRLAELADRDADAEIRLHGLMELYRITRSRKYLEEMSEFLAGEVCAWYKWNDMLERSHNRQEVASVLCDFLEKHYFVDRQDNVTIGGKPGGGKRDEVDILIRALPKVAQEALSSPDGNAQRAAPVIVKALTVYDDPRVNRTLLDLVSSTKHEGVLDEALFALAERGDGGCLETLRKYAASPDSGWAGPLTRLMLEARLSDEPLDCLVGLKKSEVSRIFDGYAISIWILPIVAEKYSIAQLQERLASDKYAPVWPVIYGTLVRKRAKTGGEESQ